MIEASRIALRNKMAYELQEAINLGKKGDKLKLKMLLSSINDKSDYEVTMNYQDGLKVNGRIYGYGDKTILIKENGVRMFVIYRNHDNDEVWLDYCYYDLQTQEEADAEYEWEKQSEKAMEEYYEGRAKGYFYDDPRGQ